ncbi:MAG: GGDEF domain-containing protein [Vampirovibrionales bacterium]|nr:GGDEF domain-containing protein [Vampirovibrionales bacterium]
MIINSSQTVPSHTVPWGQTGQALVEKPQRPIAALNKNTLLTDGFEKANSSTSISNKFGSQFRTLKFGYVTDDVLGTPSIQRQFKPSQEALDSVVTENQKARRQALANQLREAIRSLYTAIYIDSTSQAMTRRFFDQQLDHQIAQAKRDKQSIAMLFFDLDDFKGINTEFGHAGGDRALRKFADIAKAQIPNNAYLCRLGGDEFAVLFPNGIIKQSVNACAILLRTHLALDPAELVKMGDKTESLFSKPLKTSQGVLYADSKTFDSETLTRPESIVEFREFLCRAGDIALDFSKRIKSSYPRGVISTALINENREIDYHVNEPS